MNNDVVQKIFLHLPVQTLLRLRAVSKSWRDIIDSPSFRKLHTNNNSNNKRVCLQFNFPRDQHCKLSIKLLDNGSSFELPHNFNDLLPPRSDPYFDLYRYEYVEFAGPVKGLICIYSCIFKVPFIAICNPFLGQFKILPKSPFPQCECECGEVKYRIVGIGADSDGDYKVVEIVFCNFHGHYHTGVYSGRRDSWRELAGDGVDQIGRVKIIKAMKSTSKNGYFAHWVALYGVECVVLSFDMRNEVFRATKFARFTTEILAIDGEGEGEDSFVLFYPRKDDPMVEICVQHCDYWKAMVSLEETLWKGRSEYVALKNICGRREVSLYDYRAREFVGEFELEERSEIMEYVGSLVSLE